MDSEYEKIQLNKITHSVRASQAVLQYGVGAMVDFPEQTLMTAAPETWEGNVVEIHDERLEKVLHVDFFGMPGSKDDGRYQSGIAYARFPEWYFCPRCRSFKPLKDWIQEYNASPKCKKLNEKDPYMVKNLKCPSCFQELVVARIIVACGHGHIDDFPWVKWVHAKNLFGAKKICENPRLRFTTSASSTEGLEGLTITCENCHARATLKGAFDKNALVNLDKATGYEYGFACTGRHPWKNTKEFCEEYPHVLQRGGSSVYFPMIVSSLVIPPYSSQLTAKIQKSVFFSDLKKAITESIKTLSDMGIETSQEMKEKVISQKISEYASKIGRDIGQTEDAVKPILMRRWSNTADDNYTTTGVKYRAEEYEALSGEVVQEDKNGEFMREATYVEQFGLPCVKKKIVFHRLLKEQEGLLNYLVEQKSAVINGAAGTGKTMIAVEKATRHAVNGERVLFLCYNVMLRDYLDSEYHHEMIDYMTIDKFACKIGKTEEPNYQITEERVLDMYISGAFPYRHVIVDEGQDFGREEIEEANLLQTIHDAVIDNDEVEGTFYVFYDRLQLIQASRIPKYISEADCKLTLYKNCRNTENIAITSLKPISQRTPKLYDGAIKGVPARIHFREDSQEAIERIETLIDELKNEGITDVVILTCKSEFKSILKENSDNGTFKKKVFTTCRKFKGLEADAIILIDVDEDTFGSEAVQRFYVGASRARLRLEIVTTMTDENCEKVLREVVDYKKKIKNAKRELALAFNTMPIIE